MDDPVGTSTTHADETRSVVSAGEAVGRAQGELLASGACIGRYVVASHVGAGGMGRIYAAHDPELDRRVALKLLRAERNDALGRARLLGEARALAKLAHPHVVAVHDVGVVDEQVFVAMEYVSGTTLTQVLALRPHGWREVLELLMPVAHGLAAVHAVGLVHRDLKPDNIMRGDDGRVRVMDFGLARAPASGGTEPPSTALEVGSPEGALTGTGVRLGTPPYMAPEQWQGFDADARTDQFAYCVTLWQALYGERPFAGRTTVELERAITGGTVSAPVRAREVPRWLRRVLERGLAVEPSERYPSMEALVDAIAKGRRGARLRWGTTAVGLATAVLVGVGLGSSAALGRAFDGLSLPASLGRCEPHEVCAKGHRDVPICMGNDGNVRTDGSPCGESGNECEAGESCTSVKLPEGKQWRCARACQVRDDRPECVPGCYNQHCAGAFEVCMRGSGACTAVPCARDDECSAIADCDFPLRGGLGFQCNVQAGFCERMSPRSPRD